MQSYQSVVRMASGMKLEPSSVIKQAPKIHDEGGADIKEALVIANDGSVSSAHGVLQTLEPMRPTLYDQYNQATAAMGQQMHNYGLTGAYPVDAQLLATQAATTPVYSIMQDTDAYYQRQAQENYFQTNIRPVYNLCDADVLNQMRTGQPASIYGAKQPIEIMSSPTGDSGIGHDLSTPMKHDLANIEAFNGYDLLLRHQAQQGQTEASVVQSTSILGGGSAPRNRGHRASTSGERNTSRDTPVHIPKLMNNLGFQYTLESPISTMVRAEDDRMTYMNKGQYYTVSLDYLPDLTHPMSGMGARTMVMVVFREERGKSFDDEIKGWQVWRQRQHSPKQRILDVDPKNCVGIDGAITEIGYNTVQFHWMPLEQSVKLNVAIQCLSTDFSDQKGVRGLPLHLQIDTYDEGSDSKIPFHRAYCQVKVFCDKGANRKMLHEARRDERRRQSGRRRTDAEYHDNMERSPFYHMSDLQRQPVIFCALNDFETTMPSDDYNMEGSVASGSMKDTEQMNGQQSSPLPDSTPMKRSRLSGDRVMIYVRKVDETIFSAIHICPPTVTQLALSLAEKYGVPIESIQAVYRQSAQAGVTVKVDDDMVRHYANEDTYVLHLSHDESQRVALTLVQLKATNE